MDCVVLYDFLRYITPGDISVSVRPGLGNPEKCSIFVQEKIKNRHIKMKFNVAGKALQQQLTAVSKVINSKNALSILDNFLFTVKGNELTITGSDQENTISAKVEISESDSDGSIAILAKRMLDIFKEVSNQPVTFYINEETLEIDIKFLTGHFNFSGINAAEYPRQTEMEADSAKLTVPASMIQKGIENTIFAVATDTIRPVMTGIYFDIHNEDITFVSSDTHKLVKYVNKESAPQMERSFILPSKPANILRALISKEDADIVITMDSKKATFDFGNFSLTSKYILGNYPAYNRVFPENNPFLLTVDRASLLNAMRRVSLFASAASSLVRLNIQPNEVMLSAQDLDYATSAEDRVNCEYEGNSMTIGFNALYMIEVLNNLKSDSVLVKLSDPARPGLFVPQEQGEGEETLVLLMPMQVIE